MLRFVMMSLAWLTTSLAFAQQQPTGKGPTITNPVGFGDFLQMLLGLLVVLGIIFAMAWVIKRMGNVPVRMQGAIKVLAGMPVGQRERVVLVQVGDQQLLLGVAPGQIRTLHVLPTPITVGDSTTSMSGQSFAERLQAMMKSRQL